MAQSAPTSVSSCRRIFLPRYPQLGTGVRIQRETWTAGGNALLEARTLAALGTSVALLGDAVGHDAAGALVWAALEHTKIDRSHIARPPDAVTPVCRILLTPDGQRTILALRNDDVPSITPPPALLAQCRIVSLTRYGPHTARVAQCAHATGGFVVVGDATMPDDAWTPHADVVVTSADLLQCFTPPAIEAQMQRLHAVRGAAVVVTAGPDPVRVLWAEGGVAQLVTVTPPQVATTDTTGAGDVFRAAVVHGLLQHWGWPKIVAFACGVASAAVAEIV